jgi:hypothetical protein
VKKMVNLYLKRLLKQENIDFEENRNSFIIDCSGNDYDFIKMVNLVNNRIETWTYELELVLNIKIDTGYERIIIEYWED